MDTLKIGPFRGINNRLPDFALASDAGAWLKDAVNTDIDNAGRVRRRDGTTLVQAMTGAHSLYMTSDTAGFLVRASVLYAITVSPTYAETLVKVLTSNSAVSYAMQNGSLYYSNGTDSGRVESGIWFPWGMATPAAPAVSSVAGTLHAGRYQVAVRYYNNVTGEAGGVSNSTQHELATAGALRVSLPTATPGATHVQVFVSDLNGSQVYLHSVVSTGTATFDVTTTVTTTTGSPIYEEPLPAGTSLFVHMGRLCNVSGSRLHYGTPYRFGYYDPSHGYIDFEATIQLAIPNQFGTFVVTETGTHWLAGDLAKVERITDPLPYGGVAGTGFSLPHKKLVGWFGDKGFVLGDEQGVVVAATQDAVDVAATGAPYAYVAETRGYRRVVSMGYCMNVENNAVTRYDNFSVTSASNGFATKAGGLYSLSGAEVVAAHIDLGRQDFGGEQLKHLPACYLGVSSDAQMELRVETPDDENYEYLARSSGADMRIQRVDPGKGLRATWYGLSVYNTEGSDFTLASVSFAPVASGRRI